MTKLKTSELTGAALDWAVAKAVGHPVEITGPSLAGGVVIRDCRDPEFEWSPSTDWSQGGPLIESENVLLEPSGWGEWHAAHTTESEDGCPGWCSQLGNSALEAACRAIVAAKLGDEVDVPEELV